MLNSPTVRVGKRASLESTYSCISGLQNPGRGDVTPALHAPQPRLLLLTATSACKTIAGLHFGGVPEWSKGSDCKSDGSAFGGSNPPPSTKCQVSGSCLHGGVFEPMEVHEIAGSDFERCAGRGGPEGEGRDARSIILPPPPDERSCRVAAGVDAAAMCLAGVVQR